eukprot:snap_masked-scaffold_24-processed-gene-3.10-mRNA-1 protein AED:1.00 eAED:1.00 QI:0/0/0/0/1/1/2/0/64
MKRGICRDLSNLIDRKRFPRKLLSTDLSCSESSPLFITSFHVILFAFMDAMATANDSVQYQFLI